MIIQKTIIITEELFVCQDDNFVIGSLELHIFFARIMKEHSLFLKAGFTPVDSAFAQEAEFFRREFENLLSRAVCIGDGVVRGVTVCSGEFITEFTAEAERQTERFTGIPINKDITAREARLRGRDNACIRPELFRQVSALNQTALRLLDGLITLKERILSNVLCCRMFTLNYPLLLEHVLREARLYREYVCMMEEQGELSCQSMRDIEQFWNRIMMEHSLFMRGLLDPSENELVETADSFAKSFGKLLTESCRAQDRAMSGNTLKEVVKLRDFKTAGVKGIEECKIRSVILPLLADHVLREANHYIRLLEE